MKKLLSLWSLLLLAISGVWAQSPAPGILNYQGVARNSVGNVLVNKTISLRLTIRDGSAAGPSVYSETRTVTTNPFGLFNVQLGSPGATGITGSIPTVPWGVGLKFIQVEIDANGGSTFINIGSAQLASVPYSLYASTANDLVLPFNKTQADAGTLFRVTNSGTGATSMAIEGLTNSTAGNVAAIMGTVTSSSPGSFSTGVRGINNGTGGLGIGVWGSQAGSGWGVYGTAASGVGVHGLANSGVGVFGISTSGNAGRFDVNNASTTNPTVLVNGNSTSSGNAILLVNSQATAGTSNLTAMRATNSSTNDFGIGVWGGHEGSGWGVYGYARNGGASGWAAGGYFDMLSGSTAGGAAVRGNNYNNGGFAGHFINVNAGAASRALRTQGAVQMTGINEGVNRVLTSDASGNATWQTLPAVGGVTGSGTLNFVPKWTPVGTNLGNSQIIDDGTNVGINTATPTYKLDVSYTGGGSGLRVGSTSSFSVTDINAANGDAALRFANAGTMQWNIRNRPGDNYLEIFEMGSASRMAIQDGTGNVGIGNTGASILYRLDVQHGGGTGIRSQSTASFSVVDIDAANGDAALRFQKAGTGQWNIRNRPSDDYLEIFELGGGGGSRMVIQDATGNVGIGTSNPLSRLNVAQTDAIGIRSDVGYSSYNIFSRQPANLLLSNNANYGLLSHVNHSAANVPIYISGVAGVDSSNSFFSSGIAGFSRSNTTGIGVFGRASKNDPYTLGAGFNSGFMGGGFMGGDVGIFSTAGFAATGVNTDRYAVIGQAFGSGATNAVGIYGTASGATNNWAGIFAGRLAVIDGTQAVGTIFTDDGSGSGTGKWSTPAAAGLVSGTGTLNFIPKWTPSGTVLGNSMIQDNGNGVKIGTSVFYNQNSLNIYPTATSSEPSLLLGDSEVGGLFVAQSTGKLHFAMNNPLIQNGNVVMTIDDDNQQGVGIGTLAPRAKLEVTGEATGTYTFPNGFISHSAIITEQTNAGTTNNGAIAAYANGATNSNFSIVGTVGGSGTVYNAGGGFTSRNASSGTNIGVFAAAQNGASNFAGWFEGAIRIFDGTQGAGKVLTSDATGNASWVNNNYSFSTNSFSAPVSIPSGSTVPITQWNVVNYENGSAGNYNPATGEYTVPVAGVYHIDATIRINGFASDYVVFNLVKNGVNTGVDGTATFGPVVVTVSINTDIQLAAGDKISLSLFNATPAGIATFTNPANKFNVHLIHR